MIDLKDIYWAAGFIDGEGWFANQKCMASMRAKQNSPELLYRLQKIFGGNVDPAYTVKSGRYKGKKIAAYYLGTEKAAGALMTLYPIMSTKRQAEIRKVLQVWKSKPLRSCKVISLFGKCAKGHDWIPTNITIRKESNKTIKQCRLCINENRLKYYYKNKDKISQKRKDKVLANKANVGVI